MAFDMNQFCTSIGGVDERVKILRVSEAMTAEIHQVIEGLDDCADVSVCIKCLLNRYPEESLLDFCFQRLIDLRPGSISPEYRAWRDEAVSLLEILQRSGIVVWERVFYLKMRTANSKVAMNMWPQPVKFESANP